MRFISQLVLLVVLAASANGQPDHGLYVKVLDPQGQPITTGITFQLHLDSASTQCILPYDPLGVSFLWDFNATVQRFLIGTDDVANSSIDYPNVLSCNPGIRLAVFYCDSVYYQPLTIDQREVMFFSFNGGSLYDSLDITIPVCGSSSICDIELIANPAPVPQTGGSDQTINLDIVSLPNAPIVQRSIEIVHPGGSVHYMPWDSLYVYQYAKLTNMCVGTYKYIAHVEFQGGCTATDTLIVFSTGTSYSLNASNFDTYSLELNGTAFDTSSLALGFGQFLPCSICLLIASGTPAR
jgi:hypothetical protein